MPQNRNSESYYIDIMARRTLSDRDYEKIPDDTNVPSRPTPWSSLKTGTVIISIIFAVSIALVASKSAFNAFFTPVRAGCNITIDFTNSCADVRKEITTRVNGQPTSWHDPHNNGSYTFTIKDSKSRFSLERKSGTGSKIVYTDSVDFFFEDSQDEKSCHVVASSNSQVFSILDFGTNFCNMNNLYCSDKECQPFDVLEYSYTVDKCTDPTLKKCYTI